MWGTDPRWDPFCPTCGASMRVVGSPADRWWACARCDEDRLLDALSAGTEPVVMPAHRRMAHDVARREPLMIRRLPEATRTKERHSVLLHDGDGQRRAHLDGPLPLWLHQDGLTYVIDLAPHHEGSEPIWIYRAP